MLYRLIITFGIVTGLASPVWAAAAVDHGQVLAQKWCAGCHMVGAESRTSLNDAVPTFRFIAQTRESSEISGKLRNPHGGMPTDAMSDKDIVDITAYIKSLK